MFTKNNYVVGKLYTIKGENGYYNLINKAGVYSVNEDKSSMVLDIPAELITATSITISGSTKHGNVRD